MTTGVVIGKFYPPHRGHDYLINSALAEVGELFVIVCDKEGQTIPAETRAAWLRESHPSAQVIVVPDTLPDDDSAGWAAYTIGVLGFRPDVVFTSEEYGDAYASFMGSRHVCVDRERAAVPVSATMIRQDPLRHWDDIAPCVRAYYAVRVVVVGAESSGTTTLARALAEHYQTAWVPEFGRLYSEGKVTGDSAWNTDEFMFIANEQNRMEDELARIANRVLICDTDAFATGIWHERYMGSLSPEVEALSAGRRCDLYVLTDVDIPFVQDGMRDGERIRGWMHARFEEELRRRGVNFVVVSGSHERRMRAAVDACDRVIAAPTTRDRAK